MHQVGLHGRPPTRTRAGEAGFTLIELMVAISLFALLTTLGLPSFLTAIRNSQVRSVAESLQNGLRLAQAEALRRNRATVMFFTNGTLSPTAMAATTPTAPATAAADGKTWWVQTVPSAFDEPTVASTWFLGSGAFPDTGAAVQVAGGIAAVCFSPNGRLVADPALPTGGLTAACNAAPMAFNVTQTSADRPLRVTVQVNGQVRMCDPARTLASGAADGC